MYVLVDKHGHIFPKGSKLTEWEAGMVITSGEAPQHPGDTGTVGSIEDASQPLISIMDVKEVSLEWVRDNTVPFFRKLALAIKKINKYPSMLSYWKKAVKAARDAGRSIRFKRGGREYWVVEVDVSTSKNLRVAPKTAADHVKRVGPGWVRIKIRKVGGRGSDYMLTTDVKPFYQGRGAGGARPPVWYERV